MQSCYNPGTVSYYGFFASDYTDVAPAGEPFQSGALTQAMGANFAHVRDVTAGGIVAGVNAAKARGQKAMISLDKYIFDLDDVAGDHRLLYADWITRMDVLFNGGNDPANGNQYTPGLFNDPTHGNYEPFASTVIGFYILDEPYYNGYRHGNAAQGLLTDMNDVISRLNSNYGSGPRGIPKVQIYAVDELDVDNRLPGYIPSGWTNQLGKHAIKMPVGINWVGFDCYNSWSVCGPGPTYLPVTNGIVTDGFGTPRSGLPSSDSWYKRLKLLQMDGTPLGQGDFYPNGSQIRTMAVPPAYVGAWGPGDDATLTNWIPNYSYMAQDDQAVIAIFPWLFDKVWWGSNVQFGLGWRAAPPRQAFVDVCNCNLASKCFLPSVTNLAQNGSFENGSTSWLLNVSYPGSGTNWQSTPTSSTWCEDGSHCLQATGQGEAETDQNVTLTSGHRYKLTGYAQNSGNLTWMDMGVYNCGAGTVSTPQDETTAPSGSWMPVSLTFTAGATECRLFLFYKSSNSSSWAFFDNIQLVDLGGGTSFSDDFSAGTGKWTTYDGTWSIVNQQYTVGSYAGAKSIATGTSFSDFTYEADLSIDSNNAGLIFRVTNPSQGVDAYTGYYAGLALPDNAVILGKANNGWTFLASTSMTVTPNQIYHMKVAAKGNNIQVFVTDMQNPKISFNDSSYPSGAIGVRTWNSNARFDNVSATGSASGTLQNGGFESPGVNAGNNLTSWTFSSSKNGESQTEWTPYQHLGTYYNEHYMPNGGWSESDQLVASPAAGTYTLKAWVRRGSNETCQPGMPCVSAIRLGALSCDSSGHKQEQNITTSVPTDSTWHSVSFPVTVNAGMSNCMIYLYDEGSAGSYMDWDDVCFNTSCP